MSIASDMKTSVKFKAFMTNTVMMAGYEKS